MTAKKGPRPLTDEGAATPPKATAKAPAKKAKKVKAAPKPTKAKKAKKSVKAPTAADYLRDLRMMKGVEDEDFAFMSDPIAWTNTPTEWLSTGILALDRLTGGGWPSGRIIELAAWESVGKSTLVDQSIARAQAQGAVCVLIDSEQARDEDYTKTLGVDVGKLITHKAETIEEVFAGIDRVLAIQEAHIERLKGKQAGVPQMLIFWDSLAGTPTNAERDGSADDKHVASAAKAIKQSMRRLVQRLPRARATLIFTNQYYAGIGPFSSLNTYGGSGVRYFTSLRVWLSRIGSLKMTVEGKEAIIGHVVQAKIKKTRVTKPRPPAEIGLIYGAGLHNAYTLFEWGKANGAGDGHRWVQQRGAWGYLMHPPPSQEYITFQHTYLGFGELLTEHPDVYAAMVEQYKGEEA